MQIVILICCKIALPIVYIDEEGGWQAMGGTVQDPSRSSDEMFTCMVEKYQLSLLKLCFAYLHDKTLAEDAVQETFLRAYRSFSRFRRESSEKTWLAHIAINCCRDLNKSGWIRHFDRSFSAEIFPDASVQTSEFDEEITVQIMNLPVRLREVVLLYYFEDMSTVQIAKTLHISHQAVSGRLSRAICKLQKALHVEMERD